MVSQNAVSPNAVVIARGHFLNSLANYIKNEFVIPFYINTFDYLAQSKNFSIPTNVTEKEIGDYFFDKVESEIIRLFSGRGGFGFSFLDGKKFSKAELEQRLLTNSLVAEPEEASRVVSEFLDGRGFHRDGEYIYMFEKFLHNDGYKRYQLHSDINEDYIDNEDEDDDEENNHWDSESFNDLEEEMKSYGEEDEEIESFDLDA